MPGPIVTGVMRAVAVVGDSDSWRYYMRGETWGDLMSIARTANAQCSVPAPERRLSEAQVSLPEATAGAGVDLPQAMVGLNLVALGENRFIASYEARAILSYIESLERDAERRDAINGRASRNRGDAQHGSYRRYR